jgi:TPR repeat protein
MSQVKIRGASLSAIVVAAVHFAGAVSAGTLDDARTAFAKEDYAAGMAKFQEAADQGDPEALALLGTMYFYGIGVPYDRQKALELNQKAAEQGRVDAQYVLYIGYAVRSNEKDVFGPARQRMVDDSIKWTRTAEIGVVTKAEEGDPAAQWVLGELYLDVRSKFSNDKDGVNKGLAWLTKAAERNVVCAQFSLANWYEQRDPVKALELYRKAAQAGHAGAEYRLGIL